MSVQQHEDQRYREVFWMAVFICSIGVLPYIYDFFLQMSPNVMSVNIMHDFHVDAVGLGAISAFFYYAYTPTQIFAGITLDRYGPRLMLTFAILICAVGALFFSTTTSVAMASFGRFLIGVGSAFTFIAALLLISRWFSPKYFAFLSGMVQTMGSLGAIAGGAPLAMSNAAYGWRHTMFVVGIAGVLIACLLFLFVKDRPYFLSKQAERSARDSNEFRNLKSLFAYTQTWTIAWYSFLVWAPMLIFSGLWGGPFLMAKYNISETSAGALCMMTWIGAGVGSPWLGWWSERLGRRRLPLAFSGFVGAVSAVGILYIPSLSYEMMGVLLFFFGVGVSGQSLAFAVVAENVPKVITGTAIGFNNMMVVAGGMIFQPLCGYILRETSSGMMVDGVPVYTLENYEAALVVVPVVFVLSWLSAHFFVKETYCQHISERDAFLAKQSEHASLHKTKSVGA